MRKLLSLIVAAGMASALAAGTAQAGTFDPENSILKFGLAALPPIVLVGDPAGVAVLSDDGFGGHTVTDASYIWSTIGFGPGTSFFTGVPLISNLTFTLANKTGSFTSNFSTPNPVGAGTLAGFGGLEAVTGQAVLSILGILTIPIPVSVIGVGGTIMTLAFTQSITITGAPFVTGKASITGVTTNIITIPGRANATTPIVSGAPITLDPTTGETVMTLTTSGGFVSTGTAMALPAVLNTVTFEGTLNLNSASTSGTVTLVSPLRVDASGLGQGVLPGITTKTFVFVPEPAILVLLVSGAAGLAVLGTRRRRK